MAKRKVPTFISFDFDNDKKLRDFMVGQARNADTPFSVVDHSLKEAAPLANWKAKARTAIRRSEVVLVMVGPQTYKAPGVLLEVEMAREERVRVAQIIGYTDGNYKSVPNAGRLYAWSWANLEKILYNT